MLPLWDDEPRRRVPTTTLLLIAVNVAVFTYQLSLSMEGSRVLSGFVNEYALVPSRFIGKWADRQQWLTVLTSMFLHGGVAHVLGNCWFLWIFGKNVEDRLGAFRFLVLYLVSGLAAAGLQIAVSSDSALPMLGASGAISGVLGAYLVLFPGAWVYTLVPWIVPIVPIPAFVFLILWFFLQAWNGVGSLLTGEMARGGVAWWAHAGGFAAGLTLILWAKSNGLIRRR